MTVHINETFDSGFVVLRGRDGLVHLWLPRDVPGEEGQDWECYSLDHETACNLSRRLGAIIEAENDRLSKRGA